MTSADPSSNVGHGEITAVLFDMGGVVVELGPLDELLGAEIPAEAFWPRWLASPAVRAFERGHCSVDVFAAGLRDELDLDITPNEVVERFRRFPRGLFPGAAAMVSDVRRKVTTGVLSNTNALHWDTQVDADRIAGLFDRRYLSYELGLVKPDAEIFERVLADLDMAAPNVLFLDDNQVNVDAARAVGLVAHVTQGVAAASAALRCHDLLEAEPLH
ncbi:MAG: HAD family hydrolase [Acidimicrobiales bacterium]